MQKNRNNYKSHWSCDYQLVFQLVLTMQEDQKCFTATVLNRLEAICREQCDHWGIVLSNFKGSKNQVELFLDTHPNIMPSRFINSLKTVSSRLLRKEFPVNFKGETSIWSRGYILKTMQ